MVLRAGTLTFKCSLVIVEHSIYLLVTVTQEAVSTFTSRIENIPVTGGTTYLIRVSSWSEGVTGSGDMEVLFVPSGGGGVENCTNGVDDDGDGLADCEDIDCSTNPACVPPATGDECVSAEVANLGDQSF